MAAAINVTPSRLAALTRLRCSIFQTSYNPTSVRTGAKYLRARLRGPSMLNYYPPEISIARLKKENPEWKLLDMSEERRLLDVEDKKKRAKGPPKKAKTEGTSHLAQRNRPLTVCNPQRTVVGHTGNDSFIILRYVHAFSTSFSCTRHTLVNDTITLWSTQPGVILQTR